MQTAGKVQRDSRVLKKGAKSEAERSECPIRTGGLQGAGGNVRWTNNEERPLKRLAIRDSFSSSLTRLHSRKKEVFKGRTIVYFSRKR
jgi:hypothetical protein